MIYTKIPFSLANTNSISDLLDVYMHNSLRKEESTPKDSVTTFNFAGYDPAGISVKTKDDTVTVTVTDQGKTVEHREMSFGEGYDVDAVKADYKFGLLKVTVPLKQASNKQERQVKVNLS
jgi:HSP20 family molecular chaperone IbpA